MILHFGDLTLSIDHLQRQAATTVSRAAQGRMPSLVRPQCAHNADKQTRGSLAPTPLCPRLHWLYLLDSLLSFDTRLDLDIKHHLRQFLHRAITAKPVLFDDQGACIHAISRGAPSMNATALARPAHSAPSSTTHQVAISLRVYSWLKDHPKRRRAP